MAQASTTSHLEISSTPSDWEEQLSWILLLLRNVIELEIDTRM